tara:strand:- start:7 stop:207 length:201 start_codon:yes stop_codon:yes gene_type:complete
MPLYEYSCFECGESFTELREFNQIDKKIDCPHCSSCSTERLVSSFSLGNQAKKSGTACSPSNSKFT